MRETRRRGATRAGAGWRRGLAVLPVVLCGLGSAARAQDVLGTLREAVRTELKADQDDHSRWRYRDDERDKARVSIVVETDAGAVKRTMLVQGKPLSAEERQAEDSRIQEFIHNPAKLEKQRKDGEADDRQARELLEMLPDAFTWTLTGQSATEWRLRFVPNPAFHPPNMQGRVLGAMDGNLVIDKAQHRIATIDGRLSQDVTIGFGLLGRLRAGGTFRVERRQVRPEQWQITETHVHIDGKALFFKSIGQQQDEVQTEFSPVPHGTTLEQAAEMSKSPK